MGSDGHIRLVGFDFARGGADRSRTFGEQIVDDLEPAYMAPEVVARSRSTPARLPISSAPA